MGSARKLQAEIDRTLKKVYEGIEEFDEIWDKVYDTDNANHKEKYEADLKKEIKKLQRYRDQIKTWISSSDIKDKTDLVNARKAIEREMERFKVCEKETKTKAFSKEGLGQAAKVDPKEKARIEMREWLNTTADTLNSQIDEFECEIESLQTQVYKKKNQKPPPRLPHLEESVVRHKQHVARLEQMLRLLDNEAISPEDVADVKELVDDYIERNQEDFEDFATPDDLYDTLLEVMDSLVEVVGPTAQHVGVAPVKSGKEKEKDKEKDKDRDRERSTSAASKPPLTTQSSLRSISEEDEKKAIPLATSPVNIPPPPAKPAPAPAQPTQPAPPPRQLSLTQPPAPPPRDNGDAGKSSGHGTPTPGTQSGPGTPRSTQGYPPPPPPLTPPAPIAVARPPEGNPMAASPVLAPPVPTDDRRPIGMNPMQPGQPQQPAAPGKLPGQLQGSRMFANASPVPPAVALPGSDRLSTNWSFPANDSVNTAAFPQLPDNRIRPDLLADQKKRFGMSTGTRLQIGGHLQHNGVPGGSVGPIGPIGAPLPGGQSNAPQVSGAPGPHVLQKSHFSAAVSSGIPQNQGAAYLLGRPSEAPAPAVPNKDTMQRLAGMMDADDPFDKNKAQGAFGIAPQDGRLEALDDRGPLGSGLLSITNPAHNLQLLQSCASRSIPQSQDAQWNSFPTRVRPPQTGTPASYPTSKLPILDNPVLFQKLDTEALFFAFYYQPGSYRQYLAARELKNQLWRYHKQHGAWFQRHEEPKATTEKYEQGTYVYFDYNIMHDDLQSGWCYRLKQDFTFDYDALEDELV